MENQQIRINDPEVWIDAQTTHEHHGSVVIETVEVIAIIEITIARCDMAHRLRCLVDREVVEIRQHDGSVICD